MSKETDAERPHLPPTQDAAASLFQERTTYMQSKTLRSLGAPQVASYPNAPRCFTLQDMLFELILHYDVKLIANNTDNEWRLELGWWDSVGGYDDRWFHYTRPDPLVAVYAAYCWHLQRLLVPDSSQSVRSEAP